MNHFRNFKNNPQYILQIFNHKESEHIGCDFDTVLDFRFKKICVGVFKIKYKQL